MSRGFPHPSRRRLSAWLEHGDDSLDDHIDGCERCASKIEAISRPSASIADALQATLAPPPDLHPRLRTGIAKKMQLGDDMEFLIGFLGLPWATIQALSELPPEAT